MPRPDYERIGEESIAADARIDRALESEPEWRADRRARRVPRLRCPTCHGPVYVPADSHHDRVECNTCETKLVTRRALDGEVSLIVA